MGQTFYLFNIDRREKFAATSGAKLIEIFFNDHSDFLDLIEVPCFPKEAEEWIQKGRIGRQPGPFGKLSTELIDMIFKEVSRDDCFYAAMLSITCKLLFQVGKRYVVEDLLRLHARWAYKRIICLGEVRKGGALPAGMLTDAEQKEIERTYIKAVDEDPSDDSERCFNTFGVETYKDDKRVSRQLHDRIEEQCDSIYKRCRSPRNPITVRDREMFEVLVCRKYRELSYPEGPVALYNLSKGEYVVEGKLTALSLERRYDSHDLVLRMNLAHALFSRTCWSSHPLYFPMGCDKKYAKTLARGEWAGDRFCITTVEEKPKLEKGMEWKDVTREVDRLLRHLWKHNVDKNTPELSDDEEDT